MVVKKGIHSGEKINKHSGEKKRNIVVKNNKYSGEKSGEKRNKHSGKKRQKT